MGAAPAKPTRKANAIGARTGTGQTFSSTGERVVETLVPPAGARGPSGRAVSSKGGYVLGKGPVWKHPAFVGCFADRFLDSSRGGDKALAAKEELGVLKLSLELLGNALNRMVLRNGDQWAMREVRTAFGECFKMCNE